MATIGTKTFHMNELAKNLTLNVKITGVKVFRFKMKLAILLIKAAAKIMGVGVEIEVDKKCQK